MTFRRAFAGAFALLAVSASRSLAQAPCPALETRAGAIADIDERLELQLEDGSRLRLFGVEAPDPRDGTDAAIWMRAWLSDKSLIVDYLAGGLDRWGRRAARVLAPEEPADAEPVSVAGRLVETGRARVRIEPGATACLAPLLAMENAARTSKRGLWADPANAPIPADQREAFAGLAGRNVIVEGRVFGIGETATRLYLNFGQIRTVDFSATMTRANLKTFMNSGIDPHGLVGAFVRVRGQIDRRFGPQIELAYPSAIEIMPNESGSPQIRRRSKQ